MKNLGKKQKLIIFIAIILIGIIVGIAVSLNVIKINISNGKYNTANSNSSSGNLLPEYIKEGVTLGGVTGTLVDLDTSDATATAEDIMWGKTAYVNGQKITGEKVTLKVGDYVNYVPDTAVSYSLPSTVSGYENNQNISQENFTWQIVGINKSDGTINIISNKPTDQQIYFAGNLGYNNAVYVLNDICSKQYSNKGLGITARSINIEDDIEIEMNAKGIEARNSYIGNPNGPDEIVVKYGITHTYNNEDDYYYPSLYALENGSGINSTDVKTNGIKLNDSYYSQPTSDTFDSTKLLTATSTQYYMSSTQMPNYFDNKKWYNLVFGNNQEYSYWIASRCTWVTNMYIGYDIRFVESGNGLGSTGLSNSYYNVNYTRNGYLRPIATIPSNVKLYGGDGTEEHPYQLTI